MNYISNYNQLISNIGDDGLLLDADKETLIEKLTDKDDRTAFIGLFQQIIKSDLGTFKQICKISKTNDNKIVDELIPADLKVFQKEIKLIDKPLEQETDKYLILKQDESSENDFLIMFNTKNFIHNLFKNNGKLSDFDQFIDKSKKYEIIALAQMYINMVYFLNEKKPTNPLVINGLFGSFKEQFELFQKDKIDLNYVE